MEGREIDEEDWRYGYQGAFAEQDEETGYTAFELRMYDARFGRWTSVDPYGQGWSPYVGMGNMPSNLVDPDGGLPVEPIVRTITTETLVVTAANLSTPFIAKGFQFLATLAGSELMGKALSFTTGFANSLNSNITLSAFPRMDPGSQSYKLSFYYGQKAGDAASTAFGVAEGIGGAVITIGGGVVSLTGFGASVGVPAIGVGIPMIGHGFAVAGYSLSNLWDNHGRVFAEGSGNGGRSSYSGKTANEIISKFKKGSIREVFPEELLNETWEEIVKGANQGKGNYKTAKKLLGDNRFNK